MAARGAINRHTLGIAGALCAVLCAGTASPRVATAGASASGGESFRFAVVGDTQPATRIRFGQYPKVLGEIINGINALDPDFVVNVGDTMWGGCSNESSLLMQIEQFYAQMRELKAPLYIAFGNHDMDSKNAATVLQKKYGYLYKSFDYKGAHFVLLNTYLPGAWGRLGDDQLRWLEEDLSQNSTKRPIFVFMHLPLFTHGNWDEYRDPEEKKTLHSLFVRYGVSGVFGGHYHLYHCEQRDGVRYYTTGGGGGRLILVPGKGFHHFLLVTVSNGDVKVDLHRVPFVELGLHGWMELQHYSYIDEPMVTSWARDIDLLRCIHPRKDLDNTEERIFMEGFGFHGAGNYTKALECYERVLCLKKDHPGALNNKAMIDYYRGGTQRALRVFESLVAAEPGMERIRFNLAVVQAESGNPGKGLHTVSEGLMRSPRSALLRTGAGFMHAHLGKNHDAEREFREALKIEADFPLAREGLVRCYLKNGLCDAAFAECKGMIERCNDTLSWLLMGEVYLSRASYSKVADSYRRALRFGDISAGSYNNLGVACFKMGDIARARDAFRKALAVDPMLVQAKFNLAMTIISDWRTVGYDDAWSNTEAKPVEAAIALLNELDTDAVDSFTRARALNNLGVIYLTSNYFAAEIVFYYFARALASDPALSVAYANRGSLYWETDQIGLSGLEFIKALKLDPDNSKVRCNLAMLLLLENKVEEAIAMYQEILAKNPRAYEALNGLGDAYMVKHNLLPGDSRYLTMCNEAWKESYALNPSQPAVKYRLESFMAGKGRTGEVAPCDSSPVDRGEP